jgi:hypothetical protein
MFKAIASFLLPALFAMSEYLSTDPSGPAADAIHRA